MKLRYTYLLVKNFNSSISKVPSPHHLTYVGFSILPFFFCTTTPNPIYSSPFLLSLSKIIIIHPSIPPLSLLSLSLSLLIKITLPLSHGLKHFDKRKTELSKLQTLPLMAGISSFFTNNNFIPLFLLLLLHLGCFVIFSSKNHQHQQQQQTKKRRKVTPLSAVSDHYHPFPSSSSRFKIKPHKSLSSSISFVKRIFSSSSSTNPCKSTATVDQYVTTTHQQTTPASSSSISAISSHNYAAASAVGTPTQSSNSPASNIISSDYFFFPLRNDIFPCPSCGEIFQTPTLLETHQSIKHAVSELVDGDSGKNIVRIIFNTGWTTNEIERGTPNKNPNNPTIHRILKIHNSPKILSRFEEYRETVKAKAARNGGAVSRKRNERCVADGNELLRFHCTTFLCELGHDGNSSICNGQYCSVCGIVRSGFSPKMDGISTMSSSWKAHVAIPDEIEEEFRFMNVKRAMLVCRVVAGRVGCDQDDQVDKDDGGFDSVVGGGGGGVHGRVDEDELVVFNPRAVLPCFVIVYTV